MLADVRLGDSGLPAAIHELMGINPAKVATGLYINCEFNFHNAVNRDEWDSLYMFDDSEEDIPAYGVVDSLAQFVELFGVKLCASKHGYAVGFTEVKKSEQPSEGGWRWHKWGEYYGNYEPKHEYLYHEEGIEEVVTFSVLRKKS